MNAVALLEKMEDKWMTNEQRYKSALEWIAEYDIRDHHGHVDEWSEAISFHECRKKAKEALDASMSITPLEQSLRSMASYMDRQLEYEKNAQIIGIDKRNWLNLILISELDGVSPYLKEIFGEENIRINRNDPNQYETYCLIEIKAGSWYALEMNRKGEIYFDFDWLQSSSPNMKLRFATRVGYNWDEDMIRDEFQRVISQYFKAVYQFAPKRV